MNCGTDYNKAKKQAQANADYFKVPFAVRGWGVPANWYVERVDPAAYGPPGEIFYPVFCCMNNDTGCFDASCICVCRECVSVRNRTRKT